MPSKNCKREVTIKDIALLFGFRYLKVAPRFMFMITLKKKDTAEGGAFNSSWSAKVTWEEIKLLVNSKLQIPQ